MSDHPFVRRLRAFEPVARTGRVTRILPTALEADGPAAPLGAICTVQSHDGGPFLAEVVGIGRSQVTLAPLEGGRAAYPGAAVNLAPDMSNAPVGDAFLGRAVDAFGAPIDDLGPIWTLERAPLRDAPLSPLARATPRRALETGVRAIDGLLTLGEGQRIGVFAASGVGKSTLMGQLARGVAAERCVIALVGERGREVEALWNDELDAAARSRSVLVAATADQSAALRVRAVHQALALASHWRQQGRHVLLLLDSVTRLAMALRETGLAAGEPPTVRAYTPSVFSVLPQVVERCGAIRGGGAITAIMTVLAETDELDDPVCELMKSVLDGHILLSRPLAEQGHFPAIDAARSVSRLADSLVEPAARGRAREALALLGTYEAARTLVETGVYAPGSDPAIDRAIAARDDVNGFLRQGPHERSSLAQTREALDLALGGAH